MFKVKLGDVTTQPARYVPLWWDAERIPEGHSIKLKSAVARAPKESGVYVVTGNHDNRLTQSVLYVGKADSLSKRLPKSIEESLSELHAQGQREIYSDVWDLTVRWARASERGGLHKAVESLLIMSHSPPFNSQEVRRTKPDPSNHDLIVMNAGRKGPIIPIVAGAYQTPWENVAGGKLEP